MTKGEGLSMGYNRTTGETENDTHTMHTQIHQMLEDKVSKNRGVR